MKYFLFILLSLATFLSAKEVVGSVTLVDGNVKVKSDGSIRKQKVTVDFTIYSGDLISSSKDSHVKLKLVDDSVLILDELSTLHFESYKDTKQLAGKVLYKITSRDAKNSLHVTTPFAVIGIKGTTFIVNAIEDEESVSLKEGLVGIESINAKFELYRKKIDEEFNKFKTDQDKALKKRTEQQLSDFEKFKLGITDDKEEKITPIITKEFDLQAGNSVRFNGNKVKEKSFDASEENSFAYFESLFNQD